jgi:hypothetical protein
MSGARDESLLHYVLGQLEALHAELAGEHGDESSAFVPEKVFGDFTRTRSLRRGRVHAPAR